MEFRALLCVWCDTGRGSHNLQASTIMTILGFSCSSYNNARLGFPDKAKAGKASSKFT